MEYREPTSEADTGDHSAQAGPGPLSLFIGIPTYGKPDCLFAIDSGWDLLWRIGRHHPEIGRIWIQRDVRTYRQEARNHIVRAALNAGASHLLMLDDDHCFSGEDFSRIWESMQEDPYNRHLVGALYFTRSETPGPCIFRSTQQGTVPYYYYPENELMPVDVVGYGFQLFQTEVFRKICPPWFDLGKGTGEDVAFCLRWRSAGGTVWCHTGVKIGHILETPRIVGEADYLALRRQAEEGAHARLETHTLVPTGEVAVVARDRSQSSGSRPWWRPRSSHLRACEP